jgi:hypothetical protein
LSNKIDVIQALGCIAIVIQDSHFAINFFWMVYLKRCKNRKILSYYIDIRQYI